MLCQDVATCSDLTYCQGTGAVLNIGELSDAPYPYTVRVLFTDQATDRETAVENAGVGTDVTIDTEDFTPISGHTYTVKVVIADTITPTLFKPYTLSATNLFVVGTDEYMEASVRFKRVFDLQYDVTESTQQWLTIQ